MSEKNSGSKRLKTTGDMREFLADMMLGIKNGHIDIDKASRITKMAGQINESLYAETKVAQVRKAAGQEMGVLGSMPLNNTATDD